MNEFVRLCSNSEYFKQNPHKQAGEEKETTSLAFPYTIEGTKDDVLKMFAFLDNNNSLDIELLELEAMAEIEILELLNVA